MKYIRFALTIAALLCNVLSDAKNIEHTGAVKRPKLVVGVVVDQMRYDYLYRFYDKYSQGGFKRILGEGFNCRNHHYHYALTVTAAGHASVYTGSAPSVHGIVGNDWFDSHLNKRIYCVGDSSAATVGSSNAAAGRMSPKNMLVSTITDQLRLASNFQSKVIGIALKDRGAILPAGHTANAAYWFDSKTGNWITSSFYARQLPEWLVNYNARKRPAALISQGWKTLLPLEHYTESTSDNQAYEAKFLPAKKSVFPYELAGTAGDAYGILSSTPHGNTLTKEMALQALEHESLGMGAATDFLAVSFSSPDYVGHGFGPNSVEAEDIYLRLDKDIAEILARLDRKLGKDNYLFFLTADHGVMDVADFWKEHKLPAGRIDYTRMNSDVRNALKSKFGEGELIAASENFQYYLNEPLLEQKGITTEAVFKVIRKTLMHFDGVANVLNLNELYKSDLNEYQSTLYRNNFHLKRSGQIQIVVEPGWMAGPIAANHGSPYNNDTHIPLLFYGWGVKRGETFRRTAVWDTAPTLAALLSILEPNGNMGEVVVELIDR
ncbi:alkaline phosphatase PafA [Dyadobacter sp. CY312]|uniref:alkaline phosphatase PafA n=1 Tax=Dyadobacter sp. CY312 TaxID=2907303 RepID=UPI001F385986|nr:alkaline phosphatase PafA [Dyadobacter sp. CY312]MCE7041384.1 alkaline phosphatase family protein [Dyadobacter sp. CY312]